MRVAGTVLAVLLGVSTALVGADARAYWGSYKITDADKTTYACQSMDNANRVSLIVLPPKGGRDDPKRYLDVVVGVMGPVPGFGGTEGPVPLQWRLDEAAAHELEAEIVLPELVFPISVADFREWSNAQRLELSFAMQGEPITAEFDLTGFPEAAASVLLQRAVEPPTISQESPPVASPSGSAMAGIDGVTTPRLIPSSKVEPKLPKEARKKRVEGNVILQATIGTDGGLEEIQVLRCNQPGYGFEEAAVEAVRHWRYEPARKDGVPVAIPFTIFVEFKVH